MMTFGGNGRHDATVPSLTPEAFAEFGRGHVAYVKKVVFQGSEAWAIHAADGEPLAVVESEHTALWILQQNQLELSPVH